ncbi:pyruvate kinase [uncultured Sunxiuqinia sp.]|jgi:pyruvate kinase|uniref:pyruvate kinase n=1 Tax=uncultured Sunxiuqinia sp. TaxID=1573825 RepID=UPI0019A36D36|nr:pyruvate kinase [Sunxiuqinia sp.]|tara:strand:- start:12577 stop:13998 length:1422 start_codon:yes stop_codon:yes gene_type:complete
MKHTKIVATISDKRCEPEFIKALYQAGMNVARLNTAHITEETALMMVNNIRSVSDSIAILVDTKGPEIRTSNIDLPLDVKQGELIEVSGLVRTSQKGRKVLTVSYDQFHAEIPDDGIILIDDGELELSVQERFDDHVLCLVENPGEIKNKKSVNTPGFSVNLPSISEKDKAFIEFAAKHRLDFIAHSFVRNKEDVLKVQEQLDQYNSPIEIIAKIENLDGVNNINEILDYAYGIMVARGDLGIEIAAEKIPGIQRQLIKKAVQRKKPVIIATQMLHSMIENPRPTRAEVSDVANAIYSRTDAVMLSGETAYGEYPVEAVEYMSRIANQVEGSKDKRNDITLPAVNNEVVAYLAEAAILASDELQTKAIVTNTLTGKTARYLAAFRGKTPVYASCYDMSVARKLALSYGVRAVLIEPKKNKFKIVRSSLKTLEKAGKLNKEDMVVYVGGSFGIGGGSTFMEISTVDRLTYNEKK